MEILSVIGLVILIIIGAFIITLLAFALRLLLMIYSFFNTKDETGKSSTLGRFVRNASVIEVIFFLIRNRGRFKR